MDHPLDWASTNLHSLQMIKQLAQDERAGEKGFVGNFICEFPIIPTANDDADADHDGGTKVTWRQVNLSAWTSDESAHDWYVASKAHVEMVKSLKSRIPQSVDETNPDRLQSLRYDASSVFLPLLSLSVLRNARMSFASLQIIQCISEHTEGSRG